MMSIHGLKELLREINEEDMQDMRILRAIVIALVLLTVGLVAWLEITGG